ncbi:MAG TPA: hypothetical protein PLP05_02865, partial [Sedimentisphaerales bacterium]|nr:hypothetical protein [Sedimentisphaerales bacterium]
ISWTSQGITGNVSIQLTQNGGLSWSTIISNTADDGSYVWTVAGGVSAVCRVKVTSLDFPTATDMSNRNFQIAEPYITVLHPNGGEVWYVSDDEYIRWESAGVGKGVIIEISRDGGSDWNTIVRSTLNDGEYLWHVEGPESKGCLIRISDASSVSLSDTSDSRFAIFGRSLTVTAPNGGETWRIGKPYFITWGSVNITGNAKIEITYDNGSSWATIIADTANNGHYEWIPDEPVSANCLIRVTSLNHPAIYDNSDSLFVCTYLSDINIDLMVEWHDLAELVDQWLDSDDQVDCALTAELFGGDCEVDFGDYAVMASEWLKGVSE